MNKNKKEMLIEDKQYELEAFKIKAILLKHKIKATEIELLDVKQKAVFLLEQKLPLMRDLKNDIDGTIKEIQEEIDKYKKELKNDE